MPENKTGPSTPIPSADELRMALLEAEMKKMEEREKMRSVEEKKRADFAAEFLSGHVTEAEKEMIRRVVRSAVKDGKTQAMVYSFAASFARMADGPSTTTTRTGRLPCRVRPSRFTTAMSRR